MDSIHLTIPSSSVSNYSEIAQGVPLEERLHIPDNEPVPLVDHLVEVPQTLYDKGLKKDEVPTESIPYGPNGFTVATVLTGDLGEVSDAHEALPTLEGRSWPEKITFYTEFCHAAYNTPVHTKQRRVPQKRGEFATLAAEEVEKMLAELPQFPYALDQIKVVGIDVRSRGTVQARLFVAAEVSEAQSQT